MKVFSFPVLTAYARTDCNTICRCWVSSRSCSYWVPVLRTRYYHTVYSAVGDLSHFSLLTSHLSPTHLLHRSYRSKHNDAVFSFSFWLLAPPLPLFLLPPRMHLSWLLQRLPPLTMPSRPCVASETTSSLVCGSPRGSLTKSLEI